MNVFGVCMLINVFFAALGFEWHPWGMGFWLNVGFAVFNAISFAKTK